MNYAMVELSIVCPKCDNSIKFTGPLLQVHCDSCQHDIDVPKEFLVDLIKDIKQSVQKELEPGQGTNSTIFGHFNCNLTYANMKPYCTECKLDVDLEKISPQDENYRCPQCGNNIPIDSPPDWLKQEFPGITALYNCLLRDPSSDNSTSSDKIVVFTCPKCGGALDIDGKDRMVECNFCGADIYLPDDLWLRLHPVKVKRRWFFSFQ
ncbi:MAG: hypothetical protein ACP5FK_11000 [bacterium]